VREFGKIRDFWMHFESFDVILSRFDVKLLRPGTDAMASGFGTNLAEGHLSRWDTWKSGTVQLSAPLSGVSLGASHTHTHACACGLSACGVGTADVRGAGPWLGHYHGGSVVRTTTFFFVVFCFSLLCRNCR
jgi:hypothetical protein